MSGAGEKPLNPGICMACGGEMVCPAMPPIAHALRRIAGAPSSAETEHIGEGRTTHDPQAQARHLAEGPGRIVRLDSWEHVGERHTGHDPQAQAQSLAEAPERVPLPDISPRPKQHPPDRRCTGP